MARLKSCPDTKDEFSRSLFPGQPYVRPAAAVWRVAGTARARPALCSRRSGFTGFPVELGGFGKLHAPFFAERPTRCLVQRCVAGNPGREMAKKCTVGTVS